MMEDLRKLVSSSILLLSLISAAHSLECKKCSNVVIQADPSGIASHIPGLHIDANPGCKTGDIYETTTCEESFTDKSVCSYVEGKATFHIPLLGSITLGVQDRGCAQVGFSQSDGCTADNAAVLKVIGTILSSLLLPTDVEGQMCYCSTDNCIASPCDGMLIRNFCLPKWGMGLAGVAILVIGGLLLSCCCCCCCICCRNKRTTVFVQNPGDNGIRGMENPGYNQDPNRIA